MLMLKRELTTWETKLKVLRNLFQLSRYVIVHAIYILGSLLGLIFSWFSKVICSVSIVIIISTVAIMNLYAHAILLLIYVYAWNGPRKHQKN